MTDVLADDSAEQSPEETGELAYPAKTRKYSKNKPADNDTGDVSVVTADEMASTDSTAQPVVQNVVQDVVETREIVAEKSEFYFVKVIKTTNGITTKEYHSVPKALYNDAYVFGKPYRVEYI